MYKKGRINHSDLRRNTIRPYKRLEVARSPVPPKVVSKTKVVSNVVRRKAPAPPILKFDPFENLCGTFKHSGDLGDLWYSLPVMRHLGGGTLYLNPGGLNGFKPDGTPSGLNHATILMALPLLEAQPYVRAVKFWNESTPVTVDMDLFRSIDVPSDNLCNKILSAFSVPFKETETPWIQCEPKEVARIVFSRSFRYRNINTRYKELVSKYKDECVFLGLPDEHKDFEQQFGKISHYRVKDFHEMAQVINGAQMFVGNQSSPMALAIAMHKPFLQEAYVKGSDCRFPKLNGKYM